MKSTGANSEKERRKGREERRLVNHSPTEFQEEGEAGGKRWQSMGAQPCVGKGA